MSSNSGWSYELRVLLHPKVIHSPIIQRILKVPGAITFHELHQTIMMAFSWGWNEEEYKFSFSPANVTFSTKESAASGKSDHCDSKTTYLAEIVERSDFRANLKYTYTSVPWDNLRYEHLISVIRKVDRETDIDDLCTLVSGVGHCMAEGLTAREWQALKQIYKMPHEERCEDTNQMLKWYETECPNRHPKPHELEKKGAYELRFPTEPGCPLGFLRAADGCVVPQETMDRIYNDLSAEDSDTDVNTDVEDTCMEKVLPEKGGTKKVGIEDS